MLEGRLVNMITLLRVVSFVSLRLWFSVLVFLFLLCAFLVPVGCLAGSRFFSFPQVLFVQVVSWSLSGAGAGDWGSEPCRDLMHV